MNKLSLSNFLYNTEAITMNTIYNNEINLIQTEEGNAILISEKEFLSILNTMHKSDIFNNIE